MRTVSAPDGSVHTVRIEWIGNRLRRAPAELRRRVVGVGRRVGRNADVGDGCLSAGDLDELVVGLVVVLVLVLVVLVVLPTLYGLVELLVVLVVAALLWAFRVLFRRPWSIVHRGPGDVESARCAVVGWRRAHSTMVAAADEIERTGTCRGTFGALQPFS